MKRRGGDTAGDSASGAGPLQRTCCGTVPLDAGAVSV